MIIPIGCALCAVVLPVGVPCAVWCSAVLLRLWKQHWVMPKAQEESSKGADHKQLHEDCVEVEDGLRTGG